MDQGKQKKKVVVFLFFAVSLNHSLFFGRLIPPRHWPKIDFRGPSGGKNRSALRPFLTSPLRAPTLFDIAAPRSTIFLRSTLRPFFASALRAPTLFCISAPRSDLFASALRAPTYKYEKSALRAPTYFTLSAPRSTTPRTGPTFWRFCNVTSYRGLRNKVHANTRFWLAYGSYSFT